MKSIFYGMASSEGLENPLLLNEFTPIKVLIDYKPDAKSGPYWHRYLLKLPENKIKTIINKFSKQMKYGWYSIFWSEVTVYVAFTNKIFQLPKEKVWKSEKYLKLQDYALNHGSEKRYIDFNDRFRQYDQLLKKYNK